MSRRRRMLRNGRGGSLGAVCDVDGVHFAVHAGRAEAVELCLFDDQRREVARHALPGQNDGIWRGFLPGCRPGQRYGYRVHGAWNPVAGMRHNPAKLLLDPYARRLDGSFRWAPEIFDFDPAAVEGEWRRSTSDSAPCVPLCVVEPPSVNRPIVRPAVTWADTVVYELNVRGYTMRHPELSETERGRLRGLANGRIVDYLKALGVTTIELMPVFAMVDEQFLVERRLSNLWGYNTIGFFAPEPRLSGGDALGEFRDMVDSIHDAGLEVVLDVAYNHSAEGDARGPMLSFRGLDNLAYYRTFPGRPDAYVNDTGCGNTIDADSAIVQRLVLDSLEYWHEAMGVDGFRFDLATVLGRAADGFHKGHELLARIGADPHLEGAKLIAEPWDAGPGGYQLGRFPAEWAEWNDRFRDTIRRFWRGDPQQSSEFARRIHGSADLFEAGHHVPTASINFVACHDGFTLNDVVSYRKRHNAANGEQNRDGHAHNFSANYGVEGATDDQAINALRRRQRLNLLATLLLSQGTPMLLAGDEFGNGQAGNNNAYAQDNETGWVDWRGLAEDPGFTEEVRGLIRIRRELPLLRMARFIHGRMPTEPGWCDIDWLHPDGRPMEEADWNGGACLALLFSCHPDQKDSSPPSEAVALLFNAAEAPTDFILPSGLPQQWTVRFCSAGADPEMPAPGAWRLAPRSFMLAVARSN